MSNLMQVKSETVLDQRVPFIIEGFVKLNPAQMNAVIHNCSFHRQRNIVKPHIATLAKLMVDDGWLERDKIDFALMDNRLILVNGHHRGGAQIKAGIDILWTIVIHRRETMAEVDELYSLFDNNIRKRTGRNIIQGIGLADAYGLSKTMASSLWNAAPIIGTRFYDMPKGSEEYAFQYQIVDERLRVCREHKKEALEYQSLVNLTERKNHKLRQKMLTAGVTAVALTTLKYCYYDAVEFWGVLAEDDGLRKGDPRKALLVDFSNRDLSGGSVKQSTVVCIRAWNAHQRNQPVQHIRLPTKRVTEFLGTPYSVRS